MSNPLFDPATYAEVRRPALEARMLPPACYVEDEFYLRERERVSHMEAVCHAHRNWLLDRVLDDG